MAAIQENIDIKGVQAENTDHKKLMLYADNLLLKGTHKPRS